MDDRTKPTPDCVVLRASWLKAGAFLAFGGLALLGTFYLWRHGRSQHGLGLVGLFLISGFLLALGYCVTRAVLVLDARGIRQWSWRGRCVDVAWEDIAEVGLAIWPMGISKRSYERYVGVRLREGITRDAKMDESRRVCGYDLVLSTDVAGSVDEVLDQVTAHWKRHQAWSEASTSLATKRHEEAQG